MITLGSFLHREELVNLFTRWLMDQPAVGDPELLKKLINFNSYAVRLLLRKFYEELISHLFGPDFGSFSAVTKGVLKDFIVQNPPALSARSGAILKHYKKYPQDYYRETPFEGRIYHLGPRCDSKYLGSFRIKRFRRIAEKTSRRIIDFIYNQIKLNADNLAEERARKLGIPKEELITPIDEQIAEFQHAERRVLKYIRLGRLTQAMRLEPIMDIGGAKIITHGDIYNRCLHYLRSNPHTSVVEEEIHRGRYNAINIIVEYRYDKDWLLNMQPNETMRKILEFRGIESTKITKFFEDFVINAEPNVYFELILSTYEEMLESEIGRGMHEERVLDERKGQEYRGSLAKNVEYLMLVMFTYCISSVKKIENVPIKLWVKYMPDYVDVILKKLYEFPYEKSFGVDGHF